MVARHRALHTSRRAFVQGAGLAGLGLVAACGRLPGQADAPKIARIGWLGNIRADANPDPNFEAFREGLRELGYAEGQNILIEVRWAEGRVERLPALAGELVRLQPDILVTTTTLPTQAAVQATTTIPIVFIAVGDPVGLGFVTSLARPGGHITGESDLFVGLAGKRLELLKETVPSISRVAALWNPPNPSSALEWSEVQDAARNLALEVRSVEAQSSEDLAGAFETISREHADALIILTAAFLSVIGTSQLPSLIARSRLPTMHYRRADVAAGGFMSYGPSFTSLYRRAAYYVDRILKGTKPAELPVEQPREFDFVINLKTAQALGLTIPHHVLLQATEVIQ
jgi:putative tryptophan/tyrosine transport system substrate-binding protein